MIIQRHCLQRFVSVELAGGESVAVNGIPSIDIQRSIPRWTCTSGLSVCLSVCPASDSSASSLSDWTGCVAR